MWDDYDEYGKNPGLWETTKKLRGYQGLQGLQGQMSSMPGSETSESLNEKLKEMLDSITNEQARDPYEVAEKEMDRQLEKKGLPCMEKLIEVLEKNNPEYFL